MNKRRVRHDWHVLFFATLEFHMKVRGCTSTNSFETVLSLWAMIIPASHSFGKGHLGNHQAVMTSLDKKNTMYQQSLKRKLTLRPWQFSGRSWFHHSQYGINMHKHGLFSGSSGFPGQSHWPSHLSSYIMLYPASSVIAPSEPWANIVPHLQTYKDSGMTPRFWAPACRWPCLRAVSLGRPDEMGGSVGAAPIAGLPREFPMCHGWFRGSPILCHLHMSSVGLVPQKYKQRLVNVSDLGEAPRIIRQLTDGRLKWTPHWWPSSILQLASCYRGEWCL